MPRKKREGKNASKASREPAAPSGDAAASTEPTSTEAAPRNELADYLERHASELPGAVDGFRKRVREFDPPGEVARSVAVALTHMETAQLWLRRAVECAR